MGNVRDFIDYMWVYVWLCARVCTHTCTCVCIHALMCPVWDGYTSQKWRWCTDDSVLWASIPCFCPCLFLSLSSVWEQDKISPVTLCLIDSRHWSPATMSSCSLEILSFPRDPVLLSFFFSEPVTCHICCPAAPLLLVLLPSLALLPPHSSSCPTSDLIWPHVDLWASSSLVILFSRAPPSFSRVGTLSSSLKQLCVCTTVCACACCMLCCSNICVCLCMCARVCVCVFQTYLFKVSQVKMTSYSRAWNLFILFLVFFQDYRE